MLGTCQRTDANSWRRSSIRPPGRFQGHRQISRLTERLCETRAAFRTLLLDSHYLNLPGKPQKSAISATSRGAWQAASKGELFRAVTASSETLEDNLTFALATFDERMCAPEVCCVDRSEIHSEGGFQAARVHEP
jgi:hypothetical protein